MLTYPQKLLLVKRGVVTETQNHVKTYLELLEQHAQKSFTSTYLTKPTRKIYVKLENLGCSGITIVGNERVSK